MTQDDWFNIILPIIHVVFLVRLSIEYYQDKRYHKNFEDEKLKLEQEKVSLKKEIADFKKMKSKRYYTTWSEAQVSGFKGAEYKSFKTIR